MDPLTSFWFSNKRHKGISQMEPQLHPSSGNLNRTNNHTLQPFKTWPCCIHLVGRITSEKPRIWYNQSSTPNRFAMPRATSALYLLKHRFQKFIRFSKPVAELHKLFQTFSLLTVHFAPSWWEVFPQKQLRISDRLYPHWAVDLCSSDGAMNKFNRLSWRDVSHFSLDTTRLHLSHYPCGSMNHVYQSLTWCTIPVFNQYLVLRLFSYKVRAQITWMTLPVLIYQLCCWECNLSLFLS